MLLQASRGGGSSRATRAPDPPLAGAGLASACGWIIPPPLVPAGAGGQRAELNSWARSKRRAAAAGAGPAGAAARGVWRAGEATIGRRCMPAAPGGGHGAPRGAHSAARVARAAQARLPALGLLLAVLETCRKLPDRPAAGFRPGRALTCADAGSVCPAPAPKPAPAPPSPLCRFDLDSKALGHHAGHRCRPRRHCGPRRHHRQGRHRRQGGARIVTSAMCCWEGAARPGARLTPQAYPAPPCARPLQAAPRVAVRAAGVSASSSFATGARLSAKASRTAARRAAVAAQAKVRNLRCRLR